uniref:Uncharacterized protein n=1 Tax=Romanomermis culicivorax TaxID=13658 RepID=A0A915K611_ROMCU
MNRAFVGIFLKQRAIFSRTLKSSVKNVSPLFNKVQVRNYYAPPYCTPPMYFPMSGIEKFAWFLAYYFIVISYPLWVVYWSEYYIDKGSGGRREIPDVE